MTTKEPPSKRLARRLDQAGLGSLAVFFLQAIAPLASIGAQLAYIMEPFAGGVDSIVGDMARVLEEPDRLMETIDLLRREGSVK
jgi:hypothetical protein